MSYPQGKITSTNAGFTLVEIAITLVIVGLLISGVLKGVELVNTSRINGTITKVKEIEVAVQMFQEKYNGYPGDTNRAIARISGCTPANSCQNGDANLYIGAPDGVTEVYGWVSRLQPSGVAMETYQAWKHLAMADLLSGVEISSDLSPSQRGWSRSHPSSAMGGGFEFYYDARMRSGAGGAGRGGAHVMRLSMAAVGESPRNFGIVPDLAYRIDFKMDDGLPNAGSVLANYGGDEGRCKDNASSASGRYLEDGAPECVLFFKTIR